MDRENEKKKEEYVYPDGGYGWVIIFAIVLINITLLTLNYNFGIIFRDEFEDMGITAAKTSFLLHLQSSLFCLIGFFGSPLLKKYSYRRVAFVGATIWCSGIFFTSFANSYILLIITISIMTGVGQGILMPATYLATNSYFKKRLTLAISVSTTGASIFSIVSPKICDILLTKIGRKYTVLCLFSLSVCSFISCCLLKPLNNKNKDINELLKKNKKTQQDISSTNTPPSVCQETKNLIKKNNLIAKICNTFDLDLLKQSAYTIAVISLGVSFAAELNMILMMQFVLPELSNFNRTDVANVTSVQFIFDIIGRLGLPILFQFVGGSPKWIYVAALVAATGARTILAIYSQSYTAVYIACCVIGVTKGLRAVYQSVIVPQLVPLDKYAAANGFQMFFSGAISLVIGPIIGLIHDTSESYVPALHASSVLSCACIILWVFEAIFSKKIETIT